MPIGMRYSLPRYSVPCHVGCVGLRTPVSPSCIFQQWPESSGHAFFDRGHETPVDRSLETPVKPVSPRISKRGQNP